MGSIGPIAREMGSIFRLKYHLLACLLSGLMGCTPETPDTKPSQTETPSQEIKDWKLSAQGPSNWILSAKNAVKKQNKWQLTDLLWQSNQSLLKIRSPQANQKEDQTFILQPVVILGPQLEVNTPRASLDLHSHLLKGDEIVLQGHNWSLQAKHFQASFPLRHWQFKQVHAHFSGKP